MTKTLVEQPALAQPAATGDLESPSGRGPKGITNGAANDRATIPFELEPRLSDGFAGPTIPLDQSNVRTNALRDGAVTGGLTARLASAASKPAPSDRTVALAQGTAGATAVTTGLPGPTMDATIRLPAMPTDALTGNLPAPPADLLVRRAGEPIPSANRPSEPPPGTIRSDLQFDPGLATVDLGRQRTERLAPSAAPTGPRLDTDAATVPLPPSQTTPGLGRSTALIDPVPSPEDQTGALGPIDPAITTPEPGDEPIVLDLRAALAASSDDADLLFKLSVHLHRAGRTESARATLTRLAAVYEARGQHAQSARIRGMLGAPSTGPITTEDLPPRPSVRGMSGPLTSGLTLLDTGRLGLTAGLGQTVREQPPRPPATPAFPPEAMTFTDPLPFEDELTGPLREAIAQSTRDLRAGRLTAAFDACVWAVHLDHSYFPAFIRMAEINTALRQRRKARAQAESLVRLLRADGDEQHLWMAYRVLLHTSENDLPTLRRLVELLIEAERTDLASFYAAKLIQLLDQEGLTDEAIAYSARLRALIPGDTRAALENAILRVKASHLQGAVEVWEEAVAAGADPVIGKVSIAAVIGISAADDHWRMLADVGPVLRERRDRSIVDAYARTAAVLPESSLLQAGHGVLLANLDDQSARELLAGVVADRAAQSLTKAICAVSLSRLAKLGGPQQEFVASVRTSLRFLEDETIASHPCWGGLLGFCPKFDDLSLELGELLLDQGDAAGAVEVLKAAKDHAPNNERVCELLADAYFRTGQLASALTVLDELAAHHRNAGRLDAMAAVLRQMSQLAPNNIKVKSRLIDTYLQRGFVAEARAELIQRADLEERSGLIQDAMTSLVRAAELSWSTGLAEETFALYNRVIAMAPNAVEYRHGVVAYYLQLHRTAEAAEHQRAIVDISLREGRRHEAIAALHQVIGLTPDDSSAYYQLGDLLSSVGEFGQAERVYRRILSLQPDDPIALAKATAMAALKEQRGR